MEEKHHLAISWTLGFHLLSAYLITAMLNLLMYPELNLLTDLDNQLSLLSYLSRVVLIFLLLLAWEINFAKSDVRVTTFSFVLVIFTFLTAWQSTSAFIIIGLFFVLTTYYAYLFFNKITGQKTVLVGSLFIFVQIVYKMFVSHQSGIDQEFIVVFNSMDKTLLVLFILSIILAFFLTHSSNLAKFKLWARPTRLWGLLIVALLIYASTAGVWLIARVLVYASPTYDMGIFSQMFANMSKGLGPITSLERGEILSHFAVHLSPIHYLILPIYWLLPSPQTIQAAQVLVVMSGLIPLYLILTKLKWNSKLRMVFLLLYLWMPSLTSGQFYDYHENCFLAPLVLWLIYANLCQSPWKMVLASLLLLAVKEDAVIYVVCIGFYFLMQHQWPQSNESKRAIIICQIVLPISYFIGAVFWLSHFGTGAMTGRFANFMLPDQEGLVYAAINAIKNPFYTLASIFTYDKIKYLLVIFASQAFLPLMQSSWRTYLLLIPLFVINLVSDWPYQVDLFKQYHFGTSTLILFMSIITIENWQKHRRNIFLNKWFSYDQLAKFLVTLAFLVSISFFAALVGPRKYDYQAYQNNPEFYQSIQKTLDQIPRNSKVVTVSPYTTPLSTISELYDLFYHNNREVDSTIDYVVFNRPILEGQSEEKQVIEKYFAAGYTESELSSPEVVVLKH
ncbi:DUF2079 domain-containing protein [Facklamia miroungae]|uniref:Predicted membrane protein n=1 Tax=Facklamia miroungae TaxID=120956 RepID=A0A1G7TLA0_9LACT|nr:DUF2079 domain-containing protein [Facklamia miroungae]NKZ29787.1 DUF2079 domain-containing protein [Facklamia miroungae]SDG36116.1 Predicted membrane protein [Facklamia miroungae]